MDKNIIKNLKRQRRRQKIRAKIFGTKDCPRLNVFKSNTGLRLQIIDDLAGKTLVSAESREIKKKSEKADFELGRLIAEKAKAKKISQVVFDRGGYKYHGRIKAMADGAREGGLKF